MLLLLVYWCTYYERYIISVLILVFLSPFSLLPFVALCVVPVMFVFQKEKKEEENVNDGFVLCIMHLPPVT